MCYLCFSPQYLAGKLVSSRILHTLQMCWDRNNFMASMIFGLLFLLQCVWIKGKNNKNTQVGRKISIKKKSEREVCLLFWLKVCSIISDYFRPIFVLKFQLKSSVKTHAKTRGFLSLFFVVFLLYSRAILGFSLSPSLLLCAFHCFNC